MTFQQVECPAALTAKSGCVRANDAINESPTGAAVVATYSATAAASSASSASSAASSSSSGSGTGTGTVAKYGQCGGTGYTGSTTCASGSTCTYSSQYYSQCL